MSHLGFYMFKNKFKLNILILTFIFCAFIQFLIVLYVLKPNVSQYFHSHVFTNWISLFFPSASYVMQ